MSERVRVDGEQRGVIYAQYLQHVAFVHKTWNATWGGVKLRQIGVAGLVSVGGC